MDRSQTVGSPVARHMFAIRCVSSRHNGRRPLQENRHIYIAHRQPFVAEANTAGRQHAPALLRPRVVARSTDIHFSRLVHNHHPFHHLPVRSHTSARLLRVLGHRLHGLLLPFHGTEMAICTRDWIAVVLCLSRFMKAGVVAKFGLVRCRVKFSP